MKKLVFLMAVLFSLSFASCGASDTAETTGTDSIDTVVVDSVVVDSVVVDTVVVDSVK